MPKARRLTKYTPGVGRVLVGTFVEGCKFDEATREIGVDSAPFIPDRIVTQSSTKGCSALRGYISGCQHPTS